MEKYGQILLVAMPVFLGLILIEAFFAARKGMVWNWIDSISSLASGMTNILKDTLQLSIVVISYPTLLSYLGCLDWSAYPIAIYIVSFVAMDFCGYWHHRFQHEVNYLWNMHIVHHSSEEFNLPCALRQTISVFTNLYPMLTHGVLLAIMGVPKEVFAIVAPLHLFAQFWYHTRLIDKMGWLEYVLVTPSHHRVHHAMNDIYMDKNYSQVFIVWDRMFGTFQAELSEVPPVYGVRRAVQTWNPFLIGFQHLALLISDAWHTQSWYDKLRIWWMPTGWRPADVAETRPVSYVKDVEQLEKYAPTYSKAFQIWSVIQLLFLFVLLNFLFYSFGKITYPQAVIYGLFLMLFVFAFTALMDKKLYGWIADGVKLLVGLGLLYQMQDWFGLNQIWEYGATIVGFYFVVSVGIDSYFYWTELNAVQQA